MQGVLSIEISDGYQHHVLDLIGRGSVMQSFNLIFNTFTFYQARSVSTWTTRIIRVSRKSIERFIDKDQDFAKLM